MKIKELRKKEGLSQTEFAQIIGVSMRTVQNWEANNTDITVRNAQIIAEKFNIDVAQLLGNSSGEHEKTPTNNEGAEEIAERVYQKVRGSLSLMDAELNRLEILQRENIRISEEIKAMIEKQKDSAS